MKLHLTIVVLMMISQASSASGAYDSKDVRDPMVKSVRRQTKVETNTAKKASVDTRDRMGEISEILRKCRIEGVVITKARRFVLINDKMLGEGDRVLPGSDVYVAKIDYKFVTFSMDGQTVTHSLSTPKKEAQP